MSGCEKLEALKAGTFEYLIVDEACQSIELNTLIPFDHDPQKVLLVGDQMQLPATTFSENGDRTAYNRSFFERLLANGVEKFMLRIQYRMHPVIREFPSKAFYENKIIDDRSVKERYENDLLYPVILKEVGKKLPHLAFFDLSYSEEEANSVSKVNYAEARFVGLLIENLVGHLGG